MSVYRLVLLSALAVLIACTGLVIGADLSQDPALIEIGMHGR